MKPKSVTANSDSPPSITPVSQGGTAGNRRTIASSAGRPAFGTSGMTLLLAATVIPLAFTCSARAASLLRSVPATTSVTVQPGSSVTFTALGDGDSWREEFEFSEWYVDNVFARTAYFDVSKRTSYTRTFPQEGTYTIKVRARVEVSLGSDYWTNYVSWTVNVRAPYTVTIDPQGGSVSPTSKTVTYGSTYGTLPTPTRTGYNFSGWWTAISGGSQVTSSTTVTRTTNHTLYARWQVIFYTVTFDPQGGSVSPTSKTVTYGSTYGTLPTPTRTGYSFNGWWTATSGGSQVTSSTTVTTASNHTLYARWRTVTVTFDPQGGSVSPTSKTVTVGSTYGTLPTPTRTGHIFAGWWTATSGGSQVTSSTTVTRTTDHTLYARWRTVTVTFDPREGSVSPTSKTVTVGSTYGTLPTPTRWEYDFKGWWTAASGGSQVTSSTTVTTTSDHTLYARWEKTPYTVFFDPQGGSVSPTSKTVTYGNTYGTLPTPTRPDYTFAGWWTATSGGSQVFSSTTVTAIMAHTLYARWQPGTDIIVPNVVGMTQAQATAAIAAAGLSVGTISTSPSGAPGQVISQNPAAGTQVARGSAVNLTVSTDDPIPVAHWKLDESTGIIAHDAMGKHHGTLRGNPRWLPTGGVIDGALWFGGTGDYVEIADHEDFDLSIQITASAWIKVDAFDKEWQAIVTKGDSAWRLHRSGSRDAVAFHLTCPVNGRVGANGNKVVNDGNWHHVAGTYDGRTIRLYVDGKLDASLPVTGLIRTNRASIMIGDNAGVRGRYWTGVIDDVRVYSEVLNEGQTQAVMTDPGLQPGDLVNSLTVLSTPDADGWISDEDCDVPNADE